MSPDPENDRRGARDQAGKADGGEVGIGVDDDLANGLRRVAECVAGMERCLRAQDPVTGRPFADGLVETATALLDHLDRTLDTDPAWDAELISTLRVYRNAGFMFRKLVGSASRGDPATEAVCTTLIEQGHDHVRALLAQFSLPTREPSGPESSQSLTHAETLLADALDPEGILRRRAPTSEAQSPCLRER